MPSKQIAANTVARLVAQNRARVAGALTTAEAIAALDAAPTASLTGKG